MPAMSVSMNKIHEKAMEPLLVAKAMPSEPLLGRRPMTSSPR